MNDIASGTFVEKFPHWLRWLLVIPAAILGPLIIIAIQGISLYFFSRETTDSWWFILMREVIFGGGFVLLGAAIAPKKQFLVSIILLVVISTFIGISILFVLTGGSSRTPLESVFSYLINLASAGAAVYYIHQHETGELN